MLLGFSAAGPGPRASSSTNGARWDYAPYAAAVTQISNLVASLPLHLYRRVGEGRERDRDHPMDRLVAARRTPNTRASRFAGESCKTRSSPAPPMPRSWNERQGARARSGRSSPTASRPRATDGPPRLSRAHGRGGEVAPAATDLVAIVGPGSLDGVCPSSTVERGKEPIGLGLAAEPYGAKFFGNGATPGIVAQHPGKLSVRLTRGSKPPSTTSSRAPTEPTT